MDEGIFLQNKNHQRHRSGVCFGRPWGEKNFFGDGFEDQMPKNENLLKILETVFNFLCVVAIVAFILLVIYGIFEFFKKYKFTRTYAN